MTTNGDKKPGNVVPFKAPTEMVGTILDFEYGLGITKEGLIYISFNQPITEICFTPDQGLEFAKQFRKLCFKALKHGTS